MHHRVETHGRADAALVEQGRGGLVDGVAATAELDALIVQLVLVQLLQQVGDPLDPRLALVVGMGADSDDDGR